MDQPQTFRSPTALVVWVVWLLFAVGNWIDLAVQGRDHASVVAAAILLLATGVAYVTAQRPRVIVDGAGMTIKNPVRDHRISWPAVTEVDLMDLLRVHCTVGQGAAGQGAAGQGAAGQGAAGQGQGERRKVISAWAVHYSRRRKLTADVKARRATARTAGGSRPSLFGGLPAASRNLSYGTPAATRDSSDEATAKILVRLIEERATAARAESLWPASPPAPATISDTATPTPTTTSADTATPASIATSADAASSAAPVTSAGAVTSASTATRTLATDGTRLLTSTWSTTAIAALVIPALILLIVCLL